MFRITILICKISEHVLFLMLWHTVAVMTTAPGKSLQLQLGLWEGSLIFDEDPITSLGKDNILTICCCWELLGSQHCQKTSGLVATYIPTCFTNDSWEPVQKVSLQSLSETYRDMASNFSPSFGRFQILMSWKCHSKKKYRNCGKNLRLRIRISFQSFPSSGQSGWWLGMTGI